MNKAEIEETLSEMKKTQVELQTIYLDHVLALTELGAGEYAIEKLELEHELLNIKLNRAIENAEYMLTSM